MPNSSENDRIIGEKEEEGKHVKTKYRNIHN